MAKRKPTQNPRANCVDDYTNYNMREARLALGYRLADVASYAGVTAPRIGGYERMFFYPNKEVALRIADFLGKDVEDLFSETIRKRTTEIRRERSEKGKKKAETKFQNQGYVAKGKGKIWGISAEESPIDYASRNELSEVINQILETLSSRQSESIMLRYGLGTANEKMLLREIAQLHGITKEGARVNISLAMKKLRHPSRMKKLVDFLG